MNELQQDIDRTTCGMYVVDTDLDGNGPKWRYAFVADGMVYYPHIEFSDNAETIEGHIVAGPLTPAQFVGSITLCEVALNAANSGERQRVPGEASVRAGAWNSLVRIAHEWRVLVPEWRRTRRQVGAGAE